MTIDSAGTTPAKDEPAEASFLVVGEGVARRDIAYRTVSSTSEGKETDPTLVWLGGYRSDMRGTKAEHLAGSAKAKDVGFLRFDYSGHGESGGRFEEGTIGRWTEEAAAVIEAAAPGPVILVASSMGAWIALRLVRDQLESGGRRRIVGLLLLAPAPDFTHRLMLPQMTEADRQEMERDGKLVKPSAYGPEPDIYTKALFDDAAGNLVMDDLIETGCPVTVIQGMADPDVPYAHALELVSLLPHDGVVVTLVRDGDHRLSRPQDLKLIERAALDLVERFRQGE